MRSDVHDIMRLVPNLQIQRSRGRFERETRIFGIGLRPNVDLLLSEAARSDFGPGKTVGQSFLSYQVPDNES